MNDYDAKELFDKIQQNRRQIDKCPRHRFDLVDPPFLFGSKAACKNCGGQLSLIEIGAYCRGYAAAGGDPNDIVKGWG